MKVYDITYAIICRALVRQWKTILICILLFSTVGIVFGVGLYKQSSAEYANEISYILRISEDDVESINAKKNAVSLSKLYLNTVKADTTLTDEQRYDIKNLIAELEEFEDEQLMPLVWVEEIYNRIGYLDTERIAQYPEFKGLLFDMKELSRDNSHAIEELKLKRVSVADELNRIIEEVNFVVSSVAQENHLSIFFSEESVESGYNYVVPYDIPLREYEVSLRHGYGENNPEDSFQLTVLFCVLVGICVGTFTAIGKEAKKKTTE